jgi:hypothetical protein
LTRPMHSAATFRPADDMAFAAVARSWFDAVYQVLFPELWQQVDDGDPRFDVSIGVRRTWEERPEVRTYRPKRWAEVLAGLSSRPAVVTLLVRAADSDQGPAMVRANLEPATTDGQVVRVQVDAIQAESQAGDPDYCQRWVDFLATALESADPDFAMATVDNATIMTSLEMALRRSMLDGIRDSRHALRGYSWLTVCPEELSNQLGGVDGLSSSGAFAEVRHLTGGGTLLRATQTLAEFDVTALRRVFRALAPVLPPGTPYPMPGYEDLSVVYEDAATVVTDLGH